MRLRDRRGEFEALGAKLAAISVDEPAEATKMLKRLEPKGGPLGYPIYCDPTRAAVKAFGVHDAEHDIALPATLILAPDGTIVWKYVAKDQSDRPEEDAVLERVRALRAKEGA